MRLGGVLRIGGAIALLVAGLVHLDLYFGGYRSAGSVPSFGRSILANAIASGVLAVAVAARREWYVRLAGIALPVATLAALTYTHTEHTFLGFQGDGLQPSPQAQVALIAEVAAIVLLAATFVPSLARRDDSGGVLALAAAGAIVVVAFVGFGIYWANKYGTTAAAGGPTTVAIADFEFTPQVLTVAPGTTVTWTNNDSLEHSVVATDQSFTSNPLNGGTTFQFRFDTPGDHTYFCGFHPSMTATVTVTD
jgi:plastocyanin